MKTVKLASGLELSIDEENLNDMEVLDALAEAQEDDPLKISVVVKKLLGKEQRKKLYDSLRDEKKRVPIEKVTECMTEVFIALGDEGKNS